MNEVVSQDFIGMNDVTGIAPDLFEPACGFWRLKQARPSSDELWHPSFTIWFHNQQPEIIIWIRSTLVRVERGACCQQNRHCLHRLVLICEANYPTILNPIRI